MAQKETRQIFQKGINRRVAIDRTDSDMFYSLTNARLQKRGDTLTPSRIEGFRKIANQTQLPATVIDAVSFRDYIVALSSNGRITIKNVNETNNAITFDLNQTTDNGRLVVLEDTIYFTPYQVQLDYIDGDWVLNDFISETPTLTATTVSGGLLESGETYWYKIRYIYYDGHRTKTSLPKRIQTTSTDRSVQLTIPNYVSDIDGGNVDIEIYRKKGSEDFFLIERVPTDNDPFTYIDTGRRNIAPLEEEDYIWTESQVQAVVRDRLVRANNSYYDYENDIGFNVGRGSHFISNGEQILPYNSNINVYSKVRRTDGTDTYFKLHDTISVGENDNRINFRQNSLYSGDGEFQESGIYLQYETGRSESNIPFNSLEIYNANVPSLATRDEQPSEQDRPINPHIFLGFRYAQLGSNLSIRFTDNDWALDSDDNDPIGSLFISESTTQPYSDNKFDLSPSPTGTGTSIGQDLPYTRRYSVESDVGGQTDTSILELAYIEALQEAIRNRRLKVRLTGIVPGFGTLSTSIPDEDFIGYEATVVGLVDKSATKNEYFVGTNPFRQIFITPSNRLYLVLESGTPFDEFNNHTINNSGVVGNWEVDELNFDHRFEFELVGLQEFDTEDVVTDELPQEVTRHDHDYRLKLMEYPDFQSDSVTLVHTKQTNNIDSSLFIPQIQGWEKRVNNKFEYLVFNDWNINEVLITGDDIRRVKTNYPNQLIWSGPYITESNSSLVRNFSFLNFKNISADYGQIIDLQYIRNNLLVFCERGIAVVNVGEVLTQQPSGETYVDSSRFLTGDYWILKNVPAIQRFSIVQYESQLFFCDGQDVWTYSEGLNNISNGAIDIDGDITSAGVDPKNKEYRISTETQTWAYSLELGEWQGPYTYSDQMYATIGDRMFGAVDTFMVEHNIGNTFAGETYQTIIESVANHLEESTVVKLFRKFYLELSTNNAMFSYSKKHGEDYTDYNVNNAPQKNELYNIGIDPYHRNTRQLYWKIQTTAQDFVLKAISFLWDARRRR